LGIRMSVLIIQGESKKVTTSALRLGRPFRLTIRMVLPQPETVFQYNDSMAGCAISNHAHPDDIELESKYNPQQHLEHQDWTKHWDRRSLFTACRIFRQSIYSRSTSLLSLVPPNWINHRQGPILEIERRSISGAETALSILPTDSSRKQPLNGFVSIVCKARPLNRPSFMWKSINKLLPGGPGARRFQN
jgi:hypothetical protein